MRTPDRVTNALPRLGRNSIALAVAAGAALSMSAAAGTDAAQDVRLIDTPNAKRSNSILFVDGQPQHQLLSNHVVVRSEANWRELTDRVEQFLAETGIDATFESQHLSGDRRVRTIRTASVADAIRTAELAEESGLFESAEVLWFEPERKTGQDAAGRPLAPINDDVAPRGFSFDDPDFSSQWHLSNGATPGNDINALPVYARGITGAGVNIAIVSQNWSLPQLNHEDLASNFLLGSTSDFVPGFRDNPFLTAYAGLISAVGNNATDAVGVAPGSNVAVLRGLTYGDQYDAYSAQNNLFDIKVHETRIALRVEPNAGTFQSVFFFSMEDVYETADGSNVLSAYTNAVDRGRGRKGVVNVYGTGVFNTFLGYPRWLLGNQVSLPNIGGFLDVTSSGAFVDPTDFAAIGQPISYYGSQIHYYPPAARRQSFVIAPIDEFDAIIPNSTQGTEIIASTYGGFNPTGGGRGLRSLTVANGTDDINNGMISDFAPTLADDFPSLGDGAPMVAAGVFALMMEANPNLSIRDIQRILQSTAVITPAMGYNPASGVYTVNTDWQVNSAGVPHSDRYGFGKIDADAAVTAAENYQTPERLFVLDSGVVVLDTPVEIGDAEWEEVSDTFSILDLADEAADKLQFCVRQDLLIEQIELELTLSGDGASDLLIELVSPNGTISLLHTPNGNPAFPDSGAFGGQPMLNHKFTTYKHWGEPAGGVWELHITDYGPDDDTPEGDDMMDVVTALGTWGVPGDDTRSEKAIVGYRLRYFGEINGNQVFEGCPPALTNCPGDMNGDGIVTFADMVYFLGLYQSLDALADLNGDGSVTFDDLQIFIAQWRPGFCTPSGLPFGRPDSNSVNDTGPIVRPF